MSLTGPPQVTSRARSRARRVLATVVLCLVVTACSNDGDTSISGTTSSTRAASTPSDDTTTTTSPVDEPAEQGTRPAPSPGSDADPEHQEIIDRYIAYWEARFAANTGTPNPDDPALAEYATGAQLESVAAETRTNLEEGRSFREAADPVGYREVAVVSVDGDRAEVQECVVDDRLVVMRETGEVLNDEVATHNVRGTLRLVDGVWKVSGTSLIQIWEGVAGCALAS